jgi:predicted small integral membrane protein
VTAESDRRPASLTEPAEEAAVVEERSAIVTPVAHRGRRGFLPIETNWFDRVFIGVVLLVAIHLLWLRFLEQALPLPIGTALSLVLLVLIVLRG